MDATPTRRINTTLEMSLNSSEFSGSFCAGDTLEKVERELIEKTLAFCSGNKVRTAALLGVSVKTVYNKLKQYESKGKRVR